MKGTALSMDDEERLEAWVAAFSYLACLRAAAVALRRWAPVLFAGGFLRVCTQSVGGGLPGFVALSRSSDITDAEVLVLLAGTVVGLVVLSPVLFSLNCWITVG
jgi:hypothetical protein